MRRLKSKNGITLIALVVTIIVLLILAGVAISMLAGDNGILNKAAEAKTRTDQAKEDEAYRLATMEAATNLKGTTHTETVSTLIEGHQEVNVPIPAGFTISPREGEQSIETGLVVIDSTGNEYVWIPVFDSSQAEWGVDYSSVVVTGTNTQVPKTAKASEFTSDNIKAIKNALRGNPEDNYKGYTKTYYYDSSYSDVWYGDSNNGKYGYYDGSKFVYYTNGNMNETEYNTLYNNMLISIYKNGGFYIGRYEMGTAVVDSTASAQAASRTRESKEYTASTATSGTTTNTAAAVKIGASPVIKKNAVPYNYITQSQAEMLAESLNHEGGTDSLLFGVQWDMVCVYLEHFGKVDSTATQNPGTSFTSDYLKNYTYSKLWGNYKIATFKLNQGFYTKTYNSNPVTWNTTNEAKWTSESWLCTTGASEQNKALNIYDFAGNEAEWTLEECSDGNNPCVNRGSRFNVSNVASHRGDNDTVYSDYIYSASPSLYIK